MRGRPDEAGSPPVSVLHSTHRYTAWKRCSRKIMPCIAKWAWRSQGSAQRAFTSLQVQASMELDTEVSKLFAGLF